MTPKDKHGMNAGHMAKAHKARQGRCECMPDNMKQGKSYFNNVNSKEETKEEKGEKE